MKTDRTSESGIAEGGEHCHGCELQSFYIIGLKRDSCEKTIVEHPACIGHGNRYAPVPCICGDTSSDNSQSEEYGGFTEALINSNLSNS